MPQKVSLANVRVETLSINLVREDARPVPPKVKKKNLLKCNKKNYSKKVQKKCETEKVLKNCIDGKVFF